MKDKEYIDILIYYYQRLHRQSGRDMSMYIKRILRWAHES